ncbi:MAG: ASCH domain-containing protein [Bacilli bacterium]
MKVISIKQPWASLIVAGYKKFEFRTWKTNYRGEILIHASKISDKENLIRFTDLNLTYPTGQIIGKAYLADCLVMTREFEDSLISENSLVYGANHNRVGYAFKLSNVKKLDKPISINGNLGLWDFDGKIE